MASDCQYVRVNAGILDETSHVTFTRDGAEPFEDFPFERVFEDLDGPQPDSETDGAAKELRAALAWIWEPDSLSSVRGRFRTIAARFRANGRLLTGRADRAMERILAWCFGNGRRPEIAFRIFVAVCATVDPKLVGGRDYTTLARELKITKAAVSKQAHNFRDAFHWTINAFRSEAGCRNMALAVSESWRKRHETAA